MNFFNDLFSESKSLPTLKNTNDWSKEEKLQKEFEAFGFFLNEHPLDDFIDKLDKVYKTDNPFKNYYYIISPYVYLYNNKYNYVRKLFMIIK